MVTNAHTDGDKVHFSCTWSKVKNKKTENIFQLWSFVSNFVSPNADWFSIHRTRVTREKFLWWVFVVVGIFFSANHRWPYTGGLIISGQIFFHTFKRMVYAILYKTHWWWVNIFSIFFIALNWVVLVRVCLAGLLPLFTQSSDTSKFRHAFSMYICIEFAESIWEMSKHAPNTKKKTTRKWSGNYWIFS